MAITRFDPFRELASMQDRINRIFGEVYRRGDDDITMRTDWVPAVDIYENDKHEIVIKAEMPGLKKDDIEVSIENGTLNLRGRRERESDVRDEQYHRIERAYGVFSRSFTLPQTIDTANVQAEYKDGVLTLTLPKREEARPRQVQVQIQG